MFVFFRSFLFLCVCFFGGGLGLFIVGGGCGFCWVLVFFLSIIFLVCVLF